MFIFKTLDKCLMCGTKINVSKVFLLHMNSFFCFRKRFVLNKVRIVLKSP